MKYKKLKMTVAFLVAAGALIQAQIYSESKKIERSFPVSSETRLDLSNKYGTVHVIPWRKDSVHIEIDLFVKSSSNSRLEKIMRNIDFDFTDTRYYIIATTNFGNKYNTFISDLKGISGLGDKTVANLRKGSDRDADKQMAARIAQLGWAVLFPGAAQRSSTRSLGCGARIRAGSMALASWILNNPAK